MIGPISWLVLFGAWLLSMWAFHKMRRAYLTYRERWRQAVEIMEQVQVENERLVEQRNEAVELSRHLHAFAQKADARIADYDTEREHLTAALNSMIELQRADRAAEIERRRARTVAEKYKRKGYDARVSKALKQAKKAAEY